MHLPQPSERFVQCTPGQTYDSCTREKERIFCRQSLSATHKLPAVTICEIIQPSIPRINRLFLVFDVDTSFVIETALFELRKESLKQEEDLC
eukprot:SAG31_NODE_639_length_13309_cov_4.008468_4_plen_92_part_00